MLRSACSLALLCLLSCFLANSLLAHEYKTGDYVVILSNTHLEAEKPEEPHGEAVWLGRVVSVRKQVGNRLQLNGDKPGWLESQHVMPCDETAIARLTEWIAAEPENAKLYCGRGNVYAVQDNEIMAIADFTEAIKLSPEPYFYGRRAKAYLTENDSEKAYSDFQQALKGDPRCVAALQARVRYLADRHSYEQVISDLDLILQVNPLDYYTLLYRGEIWRQLGNNQKALADVEQSIQLCDTFVTSYKLKAGLCAEAQRYEEAIDACSKAIACMPSDSFAFALRGRAYYYIHDYNKAVSDCSEAIGLSSKDPDDYYYRARAYMQLKQTPQALADFEELLRLDPQSLLPYMPRSEVWAEQKQYDKAVEDLSILLERSPKNKLAREQRALYLTKLDNYLEAIQDLDVLNELEPQNGKNFYNRGIAKAHLNRLENAEDDFDEAILLAPNDAEAYRERARVALRADKFEQAFDDLAKCLQIAPGDWETLALRAMAYAHLEKYEKASADIEQALLASPDDSEVLVLAIKISSNSDKTEIALEYCTRLLTKVPDNAPGLLARAQCYVNQDKYEEALKDLDSLSFNGLDKDTQKHAKQLKIHCYSQLKQHDKVIALANELLRQDPKNAWVLLARGGSRKAQGETSLAYKDFVSVVYIGKPDQVLQSAKAQLAKLDAAKK